MTRHTGSITHILLPAFGLPYALIGLAPSYFAPGWVMPICAGTPAMP